MSVSLRRLSPLVLLIVAGLAAGGYWFFHARLAPAQPGDGTFFEPATVRRSSVSETIELAGALEAVKQKDLRFEKSKQGALLKDLRVKVGDVVAQGDVLAAIDPAPFVQALAEARVNLAAAEVQLARLTAPQSEIERSKADVAVARAELTLVQGEDELARLRAPDLAELEGRVATAETALAEAEKAAQATPLDAGYAEALRQAQELELTTAAERARLAAESYDDIYHQDRLQVAANEAADARDARIRLETERALKVLRERQAVQRASRELAAARAALQTKQAGPDGSPDAARELSRGELKVLEARAGLETARAARAKLDDGPDPAKLATAQAEVDKLRAVVKDAELALKQAEIVAPFAGTVLSTPVAVGATVGPNVATIRLADVNALQVMAWVGESQVRRLAAGQPALITFEALPFVVFSGRVKAVPLQGKIVDRVRIFYVPIRLDDPIGLPQQMGISAGVTIEVGKADDVLTVPAMAIQTDGPDTFVLRPNPEPGGEPVPAQVETGLSDGIDTEIVSGLSEGDPLLIPLEVAPEEDFGAWLKGPDLPVEGGLA